MAERTCCYQCSACRHQTSLTAGSLFQSTKLPLTIWFLAIYLCSQAKKGLSSLALQRQLGVSYPTAWMLHHKPMHAIALCEQCHSLRGLVQLDEAYLGFDHAGGKVGHGSENKLPLVAAVSLSPCRIPCDHVPIRSWPLFKARDVMRGVMESFKVEKALCPGQVISHTPIGCLIVD